MAWQLVLFLLLILNRSCCRLRFSHTIGNNLLHAAIPRPFVLWVHASIFFGWIVLFIVQITLIRTRHTRWHRRLGVAAMLLGATIPVIGVATSLEMARFDVDHGLFDAVEGAAFLSIIQRRDLLHWRASCRLLVARTTRDTPAYDAIGDVPSDAGGVRATSIYHYHCAALVSRGGCPVIARGCARHLGRTPGASGVCDQPALVVSGQIAAMWLYLARPTWWIKFAQHLF